MSTAKPCPHCGSREHQLVADEHGSVCWCHECHRTWIPGQLRAHLPANLPLKVERETRPA